jgi:hypothetical protein
LFLPEDFSFFVGTLSNYLKTKFSYAYFFDKGILNYFILKKDFVRDELLMDLPQKVNKEHHFYYDMIYATLVYYFGTKFFRKFSKLSAYYYNDVFILMKRLFAFFALRLDYL